MAFFERLYYFADGQYTSAQCDYYPNGFDDMTNWDTRRGGSIGVPTINEIRYAEDKFKVELARKRAAEIAREEHYLAEHKTNKHMEWDEWLASIE